MKKNKTEKLTQIQNKVSLPTSLTGYTNELISSLISHMQSIWMGKEKANFFFYYHNISCNLYYNLFYKIIIK